MTRLRVHQAVARTLRENDVDTIFGLVGDANMFVVDSFVEEQGGRFVSAANEVGGALMALGYALVSGNVGICSVTHGPGLTNTITALVEGVKGSCPLVLICGDTASVERENNQNVSQNELVAATGAGFEQLRAASTAVEDTARAIRRALVERRPIILNLPVDMDWLELDYAPVRVRIPERRAIVPASEDLDNAVGIIAAARRPLILAGRGAANAEGRRALAALANRIEAPLATTLKAKGLFAGEPFDLGICGTVSSPAAVDTILAADCIVAFGASLTYRTTSHGALTKGKRIIQINQDPRALGANIPFDAALVGDPAGMADLIVHWLDEADIPPSGWYSDELRSALTPAPLPHAEESHANGTVDYLRALHRLDALLPADRILVTDGGRFMGAAWTNLSVDDPSRFIASVNFASIGLGLSHAIGAAYADLERPVVLAIGDGGLMNGGLSEFNTAVRHGLDLIALVFNDGAYGAEVSKFANRHQSRTMRDGLISFDWPDFAPVAIALGGDGVTVRSSDDWPAVADAIANRTRPLLIDVKLDPSRIAMI